MLHMIGGSGWFATPRKLWTLPPQLTAIAQVCCTAVVMMHASTPNIPTYTPVAVPLHGMQLPCSTANVGR